MYECIYVGMYVYLYVYMYVCVIYVNVYVYMHSERNVYRMGNACYCDLFSACNEIQWYVIDDAQWYAIASKLCKACNVLNVVG